MEYFQELGNDILHEWLRIDCDERRLDEIASAHLSKRPPFSNVSVDDIVASTVGRERLEVQSDLASKFGQPPLTVYWHPRFRIDVLFWVTATTAVHQHGFSGAFSVLLGSSLQSRYKFQQHTRVNEQLLLGDIALHDVELLRAGDVRPISSGPGLIHAVFHLETPSVTVVVRTHRDETAQPQYEYYWPYVAMDPFHQDPNRTRRVQLLQLLDQLKSPHYVSTAKAALRASELLGVLQILWVAKSHLRETPAAFDELAASAIASHGSRVRAITAVIDERTRIETINSRRAAVHDRDHRFLLALLLNLREKGAILDAIKKWYGVEDAYELLMRWVMQLSGTSTVGVKFDELNTLIFERLLRGATIPEVLATLEVKYSYQEVQRQKQELIRHCENLQSSEMFRSLLGSWSRPPLAKLLEDRADVAESEWNSRSRLHTATSYASSVISDGHASKSSGRSKNIASAGRAATGSRQSSHIQPAPKSSALPSRSSNKRPRAARAR